MTDNSSRTGAAIEAHYRFVVWLVRTASCSEVLFRPVRNGITIIRTAPDAGRINSAGMALTDE
jgi:hypothetical protein